MANKVLLDNHQFTTALLQINELIAVHGSPIAPAPFSLMIGEQYTVVWDGVEYECTAYDGGAMMTGMVYIGNGSGFNMPGDASQPFVIAEADGTVVVMSLLDTAANTASSHTVSIAYEDVQYAIYHSTLTAIAKSIRDKTGTTEKLSPTDMPAAIEDISGGGGGSANSGSIVLCGTCGTNAIYSLTDDGTITITGNGEMTNYDGGNGPNWEKSHSKFITNAVILDGITHIGDWAFGRTDTLASVSIPQSVVSIGEYAFAYANALETVIIPKSVTTIKKRAFYHRQLTSVVFEDPSGWVCAGSLDMAGKLDDPAEAAVCLRGSYGDYVWTKTTT